MDAAVVERREDKQLVVAVLVTGISKVDVGWLCRRIRNWIAHRRPC